jgi:hypothetical protein
MNPHRTCGTCIWNVDAKCTNEAAYCYGATLLDRYTCGQHRAPLPTTGELLARLVVCTAALAHLADKAQGEYVAYFAGRAEQCRKWVRDLQEGQADLAYIAGGLTEFESISL